MTDLVTGHTILAVVVGSPAYGLAGPGSDHDRRGVALHQPVVRTRPS